MSSAEGVVLVIGCGQAAVPGVPAGVGCYPASAVAFRRDRSSPGSSSTCAAARSVDLSDRDALVAAARELAAAMPVLGVLSWDEMLVVNTAHVAQRTRPPGRGPRRGRGLPGQGPQPPGARPRPGWPSRGSTSPGTRRRPSRRRNASGTRSSSSRAGWARASAWCWPRTPRRCGRRSAPLRRSAGCAAPGLRGRRAGRGVPDRAGDQHRRRRRGRPVHPAVRGSQDGRHASLVRGARPCR